MINLTEFTLELKPYKHYQIYGDENMATITLPTPPAPTGSFFRIKKGISGKNAWDQNGRSASGKETYTVEVRHDTKKGDTTWTNWAVYTSSAEACAEIDRISNIEYAYYDAKGKVVEVVKD